MSIEDVHDYSRIDPWFLAQIEDIILTEQSLAKKTLARLDQQALLGLKRKGFSDQRIAELLDTSEANVRSLRHKEGIRPVYKRIDSCAAEFATETAYLYSTYEEECEAIPSDRDKIMILGGGPNRIGQGIEFDYCCVHAALALREAGFETIMVNCNPETVSTDFDTSDRLYFESLTFEDVMEIIELEQPKGVIVHYGGQTPLKLARALEAAGAPIIGTSPDSIDLAEDRERFQKLVQRLGLLQPPNRTASSPEEAVLVSRELEYPLVVRPSYVLGGRGMEIVFNEDELRRYINEAVEVSNESPVLLDHFLDDAVEVDIDVICDGERVLIGGVMEHIEQAGVHSGDSACSIPPFSLSEAVQQRMREQVTVLAEALGVVGLMNTQFAIKGDDIYLLEVNPRASRTAPFVSKAVAYPLAKIAALCMAGISLDQQGIGEERVPAYYSVKEAVFPFIKFKGVDPLLGPEMKSTGEVMGVGKTFAEAYAKSQRAAGVDLASSGKVLISIRGADKEKIIPVAQKLVKNGFQLVATRGTAKVLTEAGLTCVSVHKVKEGRPHVVDMIKNDEICLIINTTDGKKAIADSFTIRREALQHGVTYTTTFAGAWATCDALSQSDTHTVNCLQNLHNSLLKH